MSAPYHRGQRLRRAKELRGGGPWHPHHHTVGQAARRQEDQAETPSSRNLYQRRPAHLNRREAYDIPGNRLEGDHWFACDREGCHLKYKIDWSRYCDFEHSEKPEGKLLRIMGSIHRNSREWNGLYNMRLVVERYFSSAKRSRLLDTHKCLNLERITLQVTMSWMAYALTVLCHLKAGDTGNMLHTPVELTRD